MNEREKEYLQQWIIKVQDEKPIRRKQ